MSPVKHAILEHDVVVLRERVAAWPAGTVGTVVSDYGNVKLVEIQQSTVEPLDRLVQVPVDHLDHQHH